MTVSAKNRQTVLFWLILQGSVKLEQKFSNCSQTGKCLSSIKSRQMSNIYLFNEIKNQNQIIDVFFDPFIAATLKTHGCIMTTSVNCFSCTTAPVVQMYAYIDPNRICCYFRRIDG